ncbi:MAG: hypothetical protein II649_07015 [Kiritimatiellae bacterium]|nr:hypothetical protein [Kiritimatiellia bacterium]
MTKEQIMAALKGEKLTDAQVPSDGKVNFIEKVGFATKEQAKYLGEILSLKDEQDSFAKVSRFISANIDNAKVREVLQCHTVMLSTVVLPLQMELAQEGFAFNKDGYFCYVVRHSRFSIAFCVDKGSSITVTPWDKPYGADAVIELVRSRKEKIHNKKVGLMGIFNECENDEIADAIEKAFKEEVTA